MDKTKARIVTILMFALLVCTLYFIVTADTTAGLILLSGFSLYGLVSMGQDFMIWLQKAPTKNEKPLLSYKDFAKIPAEKKKKETTLPENGTF